MKNDTRLFERGIHNWSENSIRMILTPGQTAKNLFFYIQEIGFFETSFPYFSERRFRQRASEVRGAGLHALGRGMLLYPL